MWVWTALAVAVVGVLIARNADRQTTATAPTTRKTAVAVEASDPVAQGKARPRLVDLGAGKCIPCKMMAPILEDLQKTCAGKMDVQFIDVWENPESAKQYGIKMIPTQIFYDAAGKELFRHEGFLGKEDILAKWRELGVAL